MTELDQLDFFTDPNLVADPYPVHGGHAGGMPGTTRTPQERHSRDGLRRGRRRLGDADTFSSCTAVTGPFPASRPDQGAADDVTDIIEEYREQLPFSDPGHGDGSASTPSTARC